jgi:hypothetical protein
MLISIFKLMSKTKEIAITQRSTKKIAKVHEENNYSYTNKIL